MSRRYFFRSNAKFNSTCDKCGIAIAKNAPYGLRGNWKKLKRYPNALIAICEGCLEAWEEKRQVYLDRYQNTDDSQYELNEEFRDALGRDD